MTAGDRPADSAAEPIRRCLWLTKGEGDVVISRDMVLDIDARVRSLPIEDGGRLAMAPNSSITLTSTGNVVVLGELMMRPGAEAEDDESVDQPRTERLDRQASASNEVRHRR